MKTMTFAGAIEDVLMNAMSEDPRIVLFGEDVRAMAQKYLIRDNATVGYMVTEEREASASEMANK